LLKAIGSDGYMDIRKLMVVGALLAASGRGQSSFTVSSVKPNPSGKGGGEPLFSAAHGTLTIRNLPLDTIIAAAYGIAGYQISGPQWLRQERFDIIAKTDAPTAGEDEMRPLLQGLLAERFRLTLHRETRQLPSYVLTVAKNGPKLEAAADGGADLPFKKANKTGGKNIVADRLTMPQFAEILSHRLSHPVQDRTGLSGAYRVRLEWAAEDKAPKPGKPDKAKPAPDSQSIFTALRDQMGLRLDGHKAQVEFLVIDHVDRAPIAN
jgi:uncharacterized protein (TIGR03435 family)